MEKIDLHIHTNLSDGDLNINEIIKESKNNGCNKIAITDHEVINDYTEVSKNNSISIINGIEFNTEMRGMHILGYGIFDMQQIRTVIANLHEENEYISLKLIKKLHELGFDISKDSIDEYLSSIGIKYDFLDKRHIVKYLIYKKYVKDVQDAYCNLIGRGTNLYMELRKIPASEIIELINKSGGVAILAHPYTLNLSDKELLLKVKELLNYGLDGIEVINSTSGKDKEMDYRNIAQKLGIIYTVGSDFHSKKAQNIGILCEEGIHENLVERIKTKHKLKNDKV